MWATIASIAGLLLFVSATIGPIPLTGKSNKADKTTAEMRAGGVQVEMGMNYFCPPTRYEIKIDVGTPAQSFTAIIDSATPYTTLVDDGCADCVTSDRFTPASSSTFKREKSLRIGNLTGILGRDTVTLDADSSLTASKQAIFVLSKDDTEMFDEQDGALGLGPGTPDHPSFVESLKVQGVVDKAVVALYAPHAYWKKGENDPQIWFGGWNTDQYPEESAFTFVTANTTGGKWRFDLTGASFGSLSFPDAKAVIDTSESKLIVPKAVYDQIMAIVCPELDCSGEHDNLELKRGSNEAMMDVYLQFTIGDYPVSLTIFDLIYMKVEKRSDYYLQLDWKAGVKEWRLGHGFLMNRYTLFDYDAGRVGFGVQYDYLQENMSPLAIAGIVLLVLVFAIVLILQKCGYLKDREDSKKTEDTNEKKPEEEPLLPPGSKLGGEMEGRPTNP